MAEGKLEFSTKFDTSEFDKGVDSVQKKAKKTAETVSDATSKAAEKTTKEVGKSAEKIKEILDDTSRTERSRVNSIGAIFRKEGMNASEAMSKAWQELKKSRSAKTKKSDGDFFAPVSPDVEKEFSKKTKSLKEKIGGIQKSLNFNAKLNTKGFDKGVGSLRNGLDGVKSKLLGLASAAAAAFSVAKIIQFAKSSVEAAAQVNAANSQLSQTFGQLQENAEQAMERVAKSSGIVRSRLNSAGTSIYAFAKTSGMDSVTALNMMEEALTVAADSAAYYDRSLEDTTETLKSFLKGNFENDAALGLSSTETTRNAAANKLYGKSFIELSEAQKQLTLLQMVKDANALSGAMGQAARESEGWENVLGNLKETWRQFTAVIGQPVLRAATEAVKQMTSALERLTEKARTAVNTVMELFGQETENTAEISANIGNSTSNQQALTEAVEETAEAEKGMLAGFDKINTIGSGNDNNSDGSSSAAGNTALSTSPVITPAVDTSEADKSAERLKEKLTALSEPIKLAWEDNSPLLIENARYAADNIKGLFSAAAASLDEVWQNGSGKRLIGNTIILFGDVLGIIGDISAALKNAWEDEGRGTALVQSYSDRWNALLELIHAVAADFRTVWNDGAGEEILGNVLEILTHINNFTANLRTSFKKAWQENKVGKRLIENILGIFSSILSTVKRCTSAASEWAKNVDFSPLLESLEKVTKALRPITDNIGKGLEWLFKEVLLPLAGWVIEDYLPVFLRGVAAALRIFNSVIEVFKPLFKWLWEKALNPLAEFAGDTFIEWMEAAVSGLEEFADLVASGVPEAQEFFSGIAQKAKEAWDFIASTWGGAMVYFSDIWNGIKQTISDAVAEITAKLYIFYSGGIGIFNDLREAIKEVISQVVQWIWEHFKAAKDNIKAVWKDIPDWFSKKCKSIKEAFANVGIWFKERFQTAWDNITAVWSASVDWFDKKWDGIREIFLPVGTWFKERFQAAWDNIRSVFSGPAEFFNEVWENIKECFGSVTLWFRDTFSEAWQAVKDVFSSGGEVFTGITDGIADTFKTVVNGLIDGINWVICEPFDAINSALGGLRDFEIGGANPFGWLPYIDIPQIPYLAQGTVVPANYGNFLAMLGDNKRETEVVSPLGTIKKAVADALKENGGGQKEIVINTYLYPNSSYFHREVVKIVNGDARNRGVQ